MRSRVLAFSLLSAALGGLLIGCSPKNTGPGGKTGPADPPAPVDPGSPLWVPAPLPPSVAGVVRGEPLVIPNCVVQYDERQIVSAEVDGTIELFATHFKPNEYEALMANTKLTAQQKADQIVYHPRNPNGKNTPLKRVREGMPVEARQVLAFMDDQLVSTRMEGAKKIKESAESAKKNASDGASAAERKYKQTESVMLKGSGSPKELLDDQITWSRFLENLDQSISQIAKADSEFKEAMVLMGRHQIRSGVNGTIRTVSKRPGEYVKAGDKIMEIEGTDKVRIEGQLDVQYIRAVRFGMEVIVEPALPSAPEASHSGHRQAVTGVTVTAHPDGPLVVSVGADGAALVWDPPLASKNANTTVSVPHNLPHPVGVKSVATATAAARTVLVITGGDDGKVRVWDVTNRKQLPTAPKVVAEDAHTSAVQAIAVSPDGKYFATAAGRDVFVWDLTTVKKMYALPLEHRDSVTAINFTPQCTLVTASKDNTLKVWKVGDKGAAVARTLDHRAGAVDVLGVSSDGARVLFDQDKGRLDLVDPSNGQTVGQIQNMGSAGAFSTLAVFEPSADGAKGDPNRPHLLATAGGDGDLKGTVQVWQAPRSGRGSEVGRLITPGRVPVTTAAFSPVRGERFLAVGTSSGAVHLWKPPSEARKTHTGRIVNIDATDARYVTVRVELDNRELQLIDHSIANVIIPSDK
ncbi:HlyD family efflux transporter periplasmic adaptor subunit [Gemmata sp. JC673]|uniref:HlyD family efflux transporter periplasmic adaptor subunit n=1 Tax=Gemmata algarum TaxID=2975278 RepID=A0ABU5EZF4_9BACT|nr:HlyD family efflux transporter periplasmic adaptor subunit [Gemmata algarum]MDY3560688.1 HlyD family efflux transporter periplasmic adaptor subunit [Gemmata algarum]